LSIASELPLDEIVTLVPPSTRPLAVFVNALPPARVRPPVDWSVPEFVSALPVFEAVKASVPADCTLPELSSD
jgi:hypothetical protein